MDTKYLIGMRVRNVATNAVGTIDTDIEMHYPDNTLIKLFLKTKSK